MARVRGGTGGGQTWRAALHLPTGTPKGVWAVIGTLLLVDAVVWIGPARHAYRPSGHQLPWLALFALTTAGLILVVRFELRHQAHELYWGAVSLVVGLSMCTPAGLLAATVLAAVVVRGLIRRRPPIKVLFNTANDVLYAGLAASVYGALRGHAQPVVPSAWAAVVAAALTAELVSYLTVLAVVTSSGEHPTRSAAVSMAVGVAISDLVSTAIGIIAVLVLWVQPWGAALLLLVVLAVAAGYRAHMTLRDKHANLHLLYEFTRTLSGSRKADDVAITMLTKAAALLRAEVAELALPGPTGLVRMAIDGDRLRRVGAGAPHGIECAVMDGDRGLIVPRHGRLGAIQDDLAGRGLRDAVAAPLAGDEGPAGVLTVANRLGDVATFDRDDLRLLEALANHASVALRSGQLLDRLREEVAAKAHQARHDALTGLANRTLFSERVDAYLADPASRRSAVMLMDLDAFKEVNDTLGHHTGDTLLRETAARLVRTIGERGLVARLGGDEFAIVIPALHHASDAVAIAEELRAAVEHPLSIDELILETRASIGVALAPAHGADAITLLQRADVAMYSAKAERSGVEVYSPERDHYSPRRLTLLGELRQAIELGQLDVWYQPQADLANGRPIAVEALARWAHPKHGFIPPDEFIPLAEQSGLIRPLTMFVLRASLAQLARWNGLGMDIDLAVNLSARSLLDPGLVEDIERLVHEAGVTPSRLTLEITESTVMGDLGRSHDILVRLSSGGFHLSVDDFGTGYSSLSRLTRLPVNEVKIDKSFVFHMRSDAGDAAIVRSTIDLARHLGLRVVAEGVEDRETWDELSALGCDSAQGYYLSRPVPAAQIEEWLAVHTEVPVPVPPSAPVVPVPARAPRLLRVVSAGESG